MIILYGTVVLNNPILHIHSRVIIILVIEYFEMIGQDGNKFTSVCQIVRNGMPSSESGTFYLYSIIEKEKSVYIIISSLSI